MRKCNMRWFSPQRMKKHLAFALAVSLVAMVPVSAFAQVLKISMTKTNVSIENVLRELGRALRWNSALPKGANVNFVEVIGNDEVCIRRSDRNRIERSFQKLGIYLQDCRQSDRSVYSSCSSERGTGYPATETKKYFGGCERCNGRSHHWSIGYRKRKSD